MSRLPTRRVFVSLATWLNDHLRAHARSMGVPRAQLLRLLISDRRGAAVMGSPNALPAPSAPIESERIAFYLTLPLADADWLARTCHTAGGLSVSAALSLLFLNWCGRNPLGLPAPAAHECPAA